MIKQGSFFRIAESDRVFLVTLSATGAVFLGLVTLFVEAIGGDRELTKICWFIIGEQALFIGLICPETNSWSLITKLSSFVAVTACLLRVMG